MAHSKPQLWCMERPTLTRPESGPASLPRPSISPTGPVSLPQPERYGLSRLILLMLKPSNVSAHFAGANHGNCKRAPMQCTIKSENVKGSDLASFVKGNRTAQGEQRHVSFRLIGAAFADDPVEDDFSLGDRTPIPDDEPTPTEVVLSSEVKQSRSWRKERNAKTREALRFIARAEQARLWCEGKNILTFTGPTKMLKQYADYRAGHRVYEAAWDYVADLTGGA